MKPVYVVAAVAAGVLLAGGGFLLGRGNVEQATPAAAGASASATATEGRKVLYWHDPMVPGQRFDKPGKSPFMDMQLVPKYADEVRARDTKTAPPQAPQP